jgi:glycosyltransferase involved in cell wall biosynthesis
MKILIVNYLSVIGGVERVLERYAAELKDATHTVVYAIAENHRAEAHVEKMKRYGVSIVFFPDFLHMNVLSKSGQTADHAVRSRRQFSLQKSLMALLPVPAKHLIWHWRLTRRVVQEFRRMWDHAPIMQDAEAVLLCAGVYSWLSGGVVAFRQCGIKKVAIRLGNPPEYAPPTWIDRYRLRSVRPFFFVSRDTASQWEAALNCSLPNARVLPTPMDVPSKPVSLNWPVHGEPIRLLCLSRLTTKKGVDLAIRAVGLIVNQGCNVILDIAGSGPERERLEMLVQGLELTARIRFHGHIEDPTSIMNQSHMLLVPSRANEGLPNTLLQGMALGLLVVGADVGGIRELIGDNERGILIPPENIEALAESIIRYCNDAAFLNEARVRAHRYMLEHHELTNSLKYMLNEIGIQ